MRVHELAKELNISSKDLIAHLKKLKVSVKGHMSALDAETIELVKHELKAETKQPSGHKPKTKPSSTQKGAKEDKHPSGHKPKPKPSRTLIPSRAQAGTSEDRSKAEEVPKVEEEVKAEVESEKVEEPKPEKLLKLRFPVSVKELSAKLSLKPNELIKILIKHNIFANINQMLGEEMVAEVAKEFGFGVEQLPTEEEEIIESFNKEDDPSQLVPRAPIVTLMGHVDHGKTSLLDVIRETNITEKEAGGITQHIGAYEVVIEKGHITFLDTPGHEAFTAMRARGANVTDIVILIVAADDGIMPQTVEAIDHAREAGVPIVVAINKIDRPNADVDRVKKQLGEYDLTSEDWGGKTIVCGVSAKTKEGVKHLLEMLLLEAELLELKANPSRKADGIVVEAELSKGDGPVARVIVRNGTLKVGDVIICGSCFGKIRAMIDSKGHRVKEAPPSMPVEIQGLSGMVQAGEVFYVIEDEKKAREIASSRLEKIRGKDAAPLKKMTLEELYEQVKEGIVKELKLVIKSDVQGSLGALQDSLLKIPSKNVQLKIIHSGVGDINESDIMLAAASNAVIIGFHVKMTPTAQAKVKEQEVEVRTYRVIYEAISDVRAAMEGLLEPHVKETVLGKAQVKQVFKVSNVGQIAGCYVLSGIIARNNVIRIIRDNEIMYRGKMSSLKHLKDDVKEVKENFECGIGVSEFRGFKSGDIIESFKEEKIARKLE